MSRTTTTSFTGALLVALAVLTPSVDPASAASPGAPTVTQLHRTTSTLVVTASGHSAWLTVSAHVVSPGGDAVVHWALEQSPGTYAADGNLTGFMHLTSGTKQDGTWTVTWRATNAVRIGRFARLDVQAVAPTGTSPWVSAGVTYIKVRTKAAVTVYPKHLTRGKPYRVYATLKHIAPYVSPTGVHYMPLTRTRVAFEFDPSGPGGWRVVKTKLTDATDGAASLKVTASKSGRWRVRYKGDARNAACVTVTRKITVV